MARSCKKSHFQDKTGSFCPIRTLKICPFWMVPCSRPSMQGRVYENCYVSFLNCLLRFPLAKSQCHCLRQCLQASRPSLLTYTASFSSISLVSMLLEPLPSPPSKLYTRHLSQIGRGSVQPLPSYYCPYPTITFFNIWSLSPQLRSRDIPTARCYQLCWCPNSRNRSFRSPSPLSALYTATSWSSRLVRWR